MISHLRGSDLKRYWVSILLVLTATILTFAVRPVFHGEAPLGFFTIAVILSAGYGGIRTGLLATALSLGITLSLFHDHIVVLALANYSLTFFAVIGVAITLVIGKLRGLNRALILARDQLETANRELRVANQKLRQQTETLSRTNEELHRFAFALAHDLNTPLRSVGALTDLLIRRNAEVMDERSKECAGLIVNGVQRMASMVRALLDYAAAMNTHDDQVVIDCNIIVQQVITDLQFEIETTRTVVRFDPLPAIRVNENHLLQLFFNLIQNAVKYRSAQTPQIHISVKGEGPDWMFAVNDNGIGLDMRYAKDIFSMFKRLHDSNRYEGSGVGLALCKAVVERYGGNIWVESEPGKGATFFFTLPKMKAAETSSERMAMEQTSPQ